VDNKRRFNHKTKGMMVDIGKRNGIAIIFGIKLHGFIAWWLWRRYYLANMPLFIRKWKYLLTGLATCSLEGMSR
jgi:NADH dehydrogenase